MRLFILCLLIVILLPFAFFLYPSVYAQSDEDKLQQQIQEYEQKLQDLTGQKRTLANTISVLNTQISLTQSNIAKTEKELNKLNQDIEAISGRIGQINQALDQLSRVLIERIRATYEQSMVHPIYYFFANHGFTDFINRFKYIRTMQIHDKDIFLAMEQTKSNYDLQKTIKENKLAEIEKLRDKLKKQKAALAVQQAEKQQVLELTKNDEKKYQDLLSKARAELNAIQNIIAGKGEETKVGEVEAGNKIAAIIPSSSTCSTGAHLHFEVAKNRVHQNPANYLKSANLAYDYDTSKVPETVSPSGNWSWPLNEPVVITQIYGATFWTRFLNYDFHTGIDMKRNNDPAAAVFAVEKGTLYRGSVSCGGGNLRYVRVDQGDGLSTYYLHVNYI